MKALVLEIKNGKAAVLREDGIVVTVSQPCEVGETIELSERTVVKTGRGRGRFFRAAIAAVLALCIAGGGFGYMSVSASSYVSIDAGEASVEVAVNRFGRVIDVTALDDASSELADELRGELKHQRFEDAAPRMMDRIEERGFMQGHPDEPVLAGIVAGSDRQREMINEGLHRYFPEEGRPEGDVPPLIMMEMDRDERREALDNRQSPGRFMYDRRPPGEGGPPPDGQSGPGGPGRP
ncbi:MAG: anti-sigma factor domain-containing protein [Firmicutes bacterium]|nr:anti-sigma factor domain-containing protein [Bacillota bacterium]